MVLQHETNRLATNPLYVATPYDFEGEHFSCPTTPALRRIAACERNNPCFLAFIEQSFRTRRRVPGHRVLDAGLEEPAPDSPDSRDSGARRFGDLTLRLLATEQL